ncbi:uncharacterized protein BDZ99DRAFT_259266 [Mytilinidion resinicola]|uniref:TRAF-type zinc finger protein n=1 Tax=Mytilinidion resinicola TaxID=574789 RepID=A0A6A6YX98_9PEZI|nr:uncharacterized protein BDZ99DRAFT_259266 [Mytilinidion resinicola]KAF2813572.1 hypothetical protein BDZ99DRAFT_259266 [Mytilinidion resinicola]
MSSTPQSDDRRSRASSRADALPLSTPPLPVSTGPAVVFDSSDFVRRKSLRTQAPVDIRLLEYVPKCDSNLVCLICQCPFDIPTMLACDHVFCRECLDHAFRAQDHRSKRCPTCRTHVDPKKEPIPVPRILLSMLEDLMVKCPNTKAGCTWLNKRDGVQNHVDLYCGFSTVECPAGDCRFSVLQKDFHKGCLHYTVSCELCYTSIMKKDLEEHQRTVCAQRMIKCPHCEVEMLRLDLKVHIKDVCQFAPTACPGAIVGCGHTCDRRFVPAHAKTCSMATMAPFFQAQKTRLDDQEAAQKLLQRKVDILEGGFTNISNIVYPTNSSDDSSFPVTNPLDPNAAEPLPETPDFRLPPASFPPPAASTNNPPPPPFDISTHHLLSLHESLREEVGRIANDLASLEGRTHLLILNENQRAKEEMLHTSAAINSLRTQVHWLLSARLQQGRASASGGASASAGGSGSASVPAGSSLGSASLGPLRRLSDSTRQDTKL